MSRIFAAFRSKPASDNRSIKSMSSKKSLDGEHNELDDFLHALGAAELIMDDQFPTAEAELASRSSSFHIVGRAIVTFMKATLGMEQDIIKEAQTRLAAAESASNAAYAACVKASGNSWTSEIYDVGTEYLICYAQAQIMSAVVSVLTESLTESIKGFYKLRRAWGVLEQITAMEKRYTEQKDIKDGADLFRAGTNRTEPSNANGGATLESTAKPSSIHDLLHSEKDDAPRTSMDSGAAAQEKDAASDAGSDDFVDVGESVPAESQTFDTVTNDTTQHSNSAQSPSQPDPQSDPLTPYLTHPIEKFIHSILCTQYGMLLVLLSLIPPAFSPILSIVGFRGNRSRGLALLWRSSASETIQGAIAAIVILEFYNGLTSLLDIQTEDAYPQARLLDLLKIMRQRYPNSALWHKEEARMCSAECDLETSVAMLGGGDTLFAKHTSSTKTVSKMDDSKSFNDPDATVSLKQIEAIRLFERALDSMYLHCYFIASSSFQACIELNNWSHGMYYYIAAAAELELYHIYKHGGHILTCDSPSSSVPISMSHRAPSATYTPISPDLEKAAQHAKTATSLFEKAGPAANKKKILARQLPFDAFITRKLAKWNTLAKAENKPLVDVIVVSPLEEMQLFWGGHSRMRLPTLYESLRRLAFSDGDYSHLPTPSPDEPRPTSPLAGSLATDDKAMLALLRAITLRRIGLQHLKSSNPTARGDAASFIEQARELLQDQLIQPYEWRSFKTFVGRNGDTWPLPVGRYELAACLWAEGYQLGPEEATRDASPRTDEATKKLQECSKLLDEVSKWERYDLDVRMGIKISTGRRTLKKLGVQA